MVHWPYAPAEVDFQMPRLGRSAECHCARVCADARRVPRWWVKRGLHKKEVSALQAAPRGPLTKRRRGILQWGRLFGAFPVPRLGYIYVHVGGLLLACATWRFCHCHDKPLCYCPQQWHLPIQFESRLFRALPGLRWSHCAYMSLYPQFVYFDFW